MSSTIVKYLVVSILLFHAFISLHGFYTMFSDYTGWTLYHIRPIMQLLFTLAWGGIVLRKRWSFFLYVSLMMYELAARFFFHNYEYGQVFGDIFFPADFVFAFMTLLMYRSLFHEKPTPNIS